MTQEKAPTTIATARTPSRVAYPKFFCGMKIATRIARLMISITRFIRTCE